GLSAFYHDSAAALVQDGRIVAAAQEERFSRKRHDPRFPKNAINYCLEEAGIEADELDAVVFYDKALETWDRVVRNAMHAGPPAREQFKKAARSILGVKLWVDDHVEQAIGSKGRLGHVLFSEHHMAHAASAFYPSPFREAAILTLDGVGEWSTTSVGVGRDAEIELFEEIDYPHSIGLLYSAFTYYCGFKVNSGEYKLMGLAPYGRPIYAQKIKDHLVDIKPDGSYRLNLEYFGYVEGMGMISPKFEELFGGPARRPEARITRRDMDLAASIQAVTTELVLGIARHARQASGARNLVLAGGVALNCVANGVLLRERVFDDIWIQPAAGDAGGSVGAALLVHHKYFGHARHLSADGRDSQRGSYLGPAYKPGEIAAFLDRHDYPAERITDPSARAKIVATALSEGKVVGFFSGRMEFGPRSLGARSILGDPRAQDTQSKLNLKINYRESFRPFAPAVLAEDVGEYFEMSGESPYMLLVAPVCEKRRLPINPGLFEGDDDSNMLRIVNQARSDLPAITHVDYSARVQTVNRADHPEFHQLLQAFKDLTGVSVLVNTSFNVRGEPIVCTPKDAYTCFMRTEMDLLVLGEFLLRKHQQPRFDDDERWKTEYGDD
ncbi:MAG: carbamoyltransferase family protein, partial [Caldimonas sp.]